MTDKDWARADLRTIAMLLNGDAILEVDARGEPIVGDTLLILFNADRTDVQFPLPAWRTQGHWTPLISTSGDDAKTSPDHPGHWPLVAHSAAVLKWIADA